MNRLVRATTLALAAALALMAQAQAGQKAGEPSKPQAAAAPTAICKGPDGKPCTARQVQVLSDGIYAGKKQHEALSPVHSLTLASPDGTLKCEQSDGTACTTLQLDAIKQIAAAQQMYVNYNAAKANTAK